MDRKVKIIMMTWFFEDTISLTPPGCVETVSNPSIQISIDLHLLRNLFSFRMAIAFTMSKIDYNKVNIIFERSIVVEI
jgi:hypothetical protein